MEALKQAWVFRFWIAIGIVLLMPIIGYFANTSTLARSANSIKQTRESNAKKWKDLGQDPSPNEKWEEETKKLKEELNKEVGAAWVKLYQTQLQFMEWPQDPTREYDIPAIFEGARAKGQKVDVEVLVVYRRLFKPQLQRIYTRVEPVGIPGTKELVEMDQKLIAQFLPTWADQESEPPTTFEAWLAQEDIWILRPVLDVIRKANEKAAESAEETGVKQAIKEVMDIRIGAGAALDDASSSKANPETPLPASFGPGAEASGDAKKARYIGTAGNNLFKQMPIYLQLIVDQRKIPDVLAEFARSDLPMRVTKVELYQMSTPPPTKPGQVAGERAPAKEDEYFHRAELDVWVRAYLYEKPPSLKDSEKPAGDATSPTPAGANK